MLEELKSKQRTQGSGPFHHEKDDSSYGERRQRWTPGCSENFQRVHISLQDCKTDFGLFLCLISQSRQYSSKHLIENSSLFPSLMTISKPNYGKLRNLNLAPALLGIFQPKIDYCLGVFPWKNLWNHYRTGIVHEFSLRLCCLCSSVFISKLCLLKSLMMLLSLDPHGQSKPNTVI